MIFSYCCVQIHLNLSNKYIFLINEGKGAGKDSFHITNCKVVKVVLTNNHGLGN